MKKILLLVTCFAMLLSLAACGLFAPVTTPTTTAPTTTTPNNNNDPTDPKPTDAPEAWSISFKDGYKITDPEGLEFDNRAVLYADINNATLQMYMGMGVTINEQYIVIYEKDGKIIGEYNYMAFADEASVTAFQAMAPAMKVDGLKGTNYMDQDAIEVQIITMQANGMMTGESLADYVGMYEMVYMYAKLDQ